MEHSQLNDRRLGAIVGSIVADSGTMPLHWIYDTKKLAEIVGGDDPVFFPKPSCPFYNYEFGRNTPYGEGVVDYLEFIAEKGDGLFDPAKYSEHAFVFYDTQYTGRLNHSIKEFIKNMKEGKSWPNCGADDPQSDGLCKAGLLTALYFNSREPQVSPLLLQKVEEATRVTQNNDKAVSMALAAARLISSVIAGNSPKEAVHQVLQTIKANSPTDGLLAPLEMVVQKAGVDHAEIVRTVGSSCGYPNSFINVCHLLLGQDQLPVALKETILAGGDNASRAMFLGAVLGAKVGLSGLPEEWLKKTKDIEKILSWAKKIVKE